MFDITQVSKRYFGIRLVATDDQGAEHSVELEVAPAKLKTLNQLTAVKKEAEENALPAMQEAVSKLLCNNKTGYDLPVEYVTAMDTDQLNGIVEAYFNWLNETKKSSPN